MKKNCWRSILMFSGLIFLLFCAGCAFGGRDDSDAESSFAEDRENQRGPAPEGDPKWFLNGVSYDEKSIRELIGYFPNLTASENLYFEIPEKCQLYQYGFEAPKDRSNRPYFEEFYEAFHFFFPGHDLDENYLYYSDDVSQRTNEGGLNLLKDHKEEVLADKNGVAVFYYNESEKPDSASGETRVRLELGNPIGYGSAYVSKGKTVELMKTAPGRVEIYSGVYSEDPTEVFSAVGYYSPKSGQSFQLADKEVTIRDAVAFFEKYMAELPFPKESDMVVKVREVCVLEISPGQYAYNFLTAGTFDGIPMDSIRSGTSTSDTGNYVHSGGTALMLESGDIDRIENFRKKMTPKDLVEIQEGISLEKALSLLSERLTDHVDFEMDRIEIVYRSRYIPDEKGHINIVTYAQELAPWWKFTLYNSNDSLTYMFYVDAANGKLDYLTAGGRFNLQR